jgi:hypothetical protein
VLQYYDTMMMMMRGTLLHTTPHARALPCPALPCPACQAKRMWYLLTHVCVSRAGSLPASKSTAPTSASTAGGGSTTTGSTTTGGAIKPKGAGAMPWASMGLGAGAAAAELEEDELESFS